MTRKYELIYIVSPDATETEVADLQTQVEAIMERLGVGTIEKTDNWGRRRLAYAIGRHKDGVYVIHTINGTGELMKEVDRRLKVSELVIRHLVVRVDELEGVMARTQAARAVTSRRRRVARGLPPDRMPDEGQRGDGDDDDRFDGAGGER
jgi:small subunit ribosomal protein S6